MAIQDNIRRLRKERGLTQEDLAKLIGVGRTSVTQWERGAQDPLMGNVQKMAGVFGVATSVIVGDEEFIMANCNGERHPRPILGRIAAGEARDACEIEGETLDVDEEIWERWPDGKWFQVAGNSMNRLFPDGAMVYLDVDLEPGEVRNGDVAALFVNGDEATVKRVYFEDGGTVIRLHPESYDPEYRDYVIDASDPDAPDVRFIGRVVAYKSRPGWRP